MVTRSKTPGGHEPRPVHYPESDGKPMAESDLHRKEMTRLIETLDNFFADRPDIYVSGNLLLYYEEGNPRASAAPDVFVVRGVPKRDRPIYKLWEEGVAPAVVIEVTSPTTRREDLAKKRTLYARLGVAEYYLYDPLAEYLDPPFQGYRLDGADYRAMATDATGALTSEALGLRLLLVEGRLRLFERQSGAPARSPAERVAEAERRIAELEAELRRRGPPE
jgi:Uma2 family endonuclease